MISRIHIVIRGAVQGVGFRPFVYKIANEMNLNGYVLNSSAGVFIEAEAEESVLKKFVRRIENEKPSLRVITNLEYSFLDPVNYKNFEIRKSNRQGEVSALILPDISICKDCLKELMNPEDRRYLYPFINCTNCGPRFSIIESLPYDRPNTSMKNFEMCDKCREEYENPADRRFHAQPVACPECGPHIEFWNTVGEKISTHNQALIEAAEEIRQGRIVALKGLGGFQLLTDASNESAVKLLRKRKHRDEKPFALMFPDLDMIKKICEVSDVEERTLLSPESPIVLLKKKTDKFKIQNSGLDVASSVAPGNPYLGIMLPYTPLHHLLMRMLGFPIIATSGNLAEEPMCIDEYEALKRLNGIADFYLIHNRPIVRHVDDSIVRVMMNREMVLRRARGFAPLPIPVAPEKIEANEGSVLAVGAHLKNTIALKSGNNIFTSQHIGDLSTEESNNAFRKVIADFKSLYRTELSAIISDMHPEYLSTKYSESFNTKRYTVQHHYAHIAACRIENSIAGDALGVSWDGTGYGEDNTIWGGEFFLSSDNSYEHFSQFRKFPLPGGEFAIKESRRSALALCYEIYGDSFDDELVSMNFDSNEFIVLKNMLGKNINSPLTSSAGRLFDAVSSLTGLCHKSNFEGQAAMLLEFAAVETEQKFYPFEIKKNNILVIDWQPMIESIIQDVKSGLSVHIISSKFHNTLSQIILSVAKRSGRSKVILSGGCFQNKFLTERTIKLLQQNEFHVYWHQRIPPNDGGISVGQIAAFLSGSYRRSEITRDENISKVAKNVNKNLFEKEIR